jgi:hypothetical protein
MSATTVADIRLAERSRRRATRASRWLRNGAWYVVLTVMAVITVFPFAWMLLTSIKGPSDPITSVPPQFFPNDPTLAAYARVWDQLPIPSFFLNSTIVAVATGLLNVLVAAMAAYPLAKMRFAGRDFVFYLLLATLIVPAQLTYIPSFILAVNVFHYYDTLAAPSTSSCCARRSAACPTSWSMPPGSTGQASGASGGRSCCRSSARRWRRSRSSRSSRRGTTSSGRR